MLGAQLAEKRDQLRMGDAAGQRLQLEPVARLEQLRRDGARRRSPGRREPRLRLARQIQQVRGNAQRLLALRRVLEGPQDLANAGEPRLLVREEPLDLE